VRDLLAAAKKRRLLDASSSGEGNVSENTGFQPVAPLAVGKFLFVLVWFAYTYFTMKGK